MFHSEFIYRLSSNKNKIVLWFPGANDTFYHQEQINKGLFKDYDIFIFHPLDYHPCDPNNETNPPGHITENFYIYFSSINNSFETNQLMDYKEIIIYSHSTGCLLSIEYALYGKYKNFISKIIFDDPFLDYNQPNLVKKFFQKNPLLNPIAWKYHNLIFTYNMKSLLSKNNNSKIKIHQKNIGYNLPFIFENNDYTAFTMACSRTQNIIQNAKKPLLQIPCLILIAGDNKTLIEKDIRKYSYNISNYIEIKTIQNAYHSCLLPDNKNDLEKIINLINNFLYQCNVDISREINNNEPQIIEYHNKFSFIPTIFIYGFFSFFLYKIINIIL